MGILLCTIACQKETTADSVEPTIDSIWTAAPKLEPEPLPPGDEMILGDPIDSPHTVENMKKALKSLRHQREQNFLKIIKSLQRIIISSCIRNRMLILIRYLNIDI